MTEYTFLALVHLLLVSATRDLNRQLYLLNYWSDNKNANTVKSEISITFRVMSQKVVTVWEI